MNCNDVFNTLYKNEQKRGCPDDLIKAQSWIINVRKTVKQKEEIDRYNFTDHHAQMSRHHQP